MARTKHIPRCPRLTLDLLEAFSDELTTCSERVIIALDEIWKPLEDGNPLTLDALNAAGISIVNMQLILNKMYRRLLSERQRILTCGEQAGAPQEVSWAKESMPVA